MGLISCFSNCWPQAGLFQGPYTIAGFILIAILSFLAMVLSFKNSVSVRRIDRAIFWVMGLILLIFATLRPIGLARDDEAYIDILNALCPLGDCQNGMPIKRDHAWFYLMKFAVPLQLGGLRLALVLSGIGVLIKLMVIDRLCRNRLLALLLFIPMCYIQYDLTQLRAGLAIAWMMVGLYLLIRSYWVLGAVILCTNFAAHFQAIFSSAFLTYKLFRISRWILPGCLIIFIFLIYSGLYPSSKNLDWLGSMAITTPYIKNLQGGDYVGIKIFPLAYLPILAYGVWLCTTAGVAEQKLAEIASTGLLLGVFLAWFFAVIPTVQTRSIEFYSLPIIFLAGNVGQSRVKIVATCILAILLYLRLELLHDWILG